MPGKWRGIKQLQTQEPGALTIKIEHDPGGLLAGVTRYFLPQTNVHLLAPRVRPRDLPFETISRQHPMLIQNFSCTGVGHPDVTDIPDVGCVLFAPPSFALDETYSFNRTFLFLSFDDMTDREAGGRWNLGRNVAMRLVTDPDRTRVDRDLHVNFHVSPSLSQNAQSQRLRLKWGANRTGEIVVATEEWISAPVSAGDWTGSHLRRLPISIAFTDRRAVLFHGLSVSEQPRGRRVQ
jgi:hypothetical protein